MESFGIKQYSETKGKEILNDGETPYCDKESKPKIPFYKKIIIILFVSIILIILIVIVILFFTVYLTDTCDIENGYYIPEDKTEEKKCLKCDLNCKTCHGNISQSQCDTCFASFIPSYENDTIKFCNKKCEEGEKESCQECDINKNECISCNFGFFMPEDEERKVECQKCAVDYCDECSGTKNSNKCKSCINSYSPIYEGNEIVKCVCEVGEKEKCMKCDVDKNECIACNEGYRLLNGKCFSYSFKAIYNAKSGEDYTYIINPNYLKNIKMMIIDGNETKPYTRYAFPNLGNHTIYFYFDMQNLRKLNEMFCSYYSSNLVEISFTPYFNTQNITDMSDMFSYCETLVSANLSYFNTTNVLNMRSMFWRCYSVKYLDISSFI